MVGIWKYRNCWFLPLSNMWSTCGTSRVSMTFECTLDQMMIMSIFVDVCHHYSLYLYGKHKDHMTYHSSLVALYQPHRGERKVCNRRSCWHSLSCWLWQHKKCKGVVNAPYLVGYVDEDLSILSAFVGYDDEKLLRNYRCSPPSWLQWWKIVM